MTTTSTTDARLPGRTSPAIMEQGARVDRAPTPPQSHPCSIFHPVAAVVVITILLAYRTTVNCHHHHQLNWHSVTCAFPILSQWQPTTTEPPPEPPPPPPVSYFNEDCPLLISSARVNNHTNSWDYLGIMNEKSMEASLVHRLSSSSTRPMFKKDTISHHRVYEIGWTYYLKLVVL